MKNQSPKLFKWTIRQKLHKQRKSLILLRRAMKKPKWMRMKICRKLKTSQKARKRRRKRTEKIKRALINF